MGRKLRGGKMIDWRIDFWSGLLTAAGGIVFIYLTAIHFPLKRWNND
jgi:hypothetical protein